MRKTLALLVCCFGLLFSPLALAEVPESTWDGMVGHSVLLTNPQGKEIRGTLLDAEGDTLRIERADGSVVTVGKAEVATAKNLSKPAPAPTPKEPEPEPVAPIAPEPNAPDPAPQAEPEVPQPEVPGPLTSEEPARPDPNQEQLMQDGVAGEVDGRAAAQMQSLTGPIAVSAGVGLASGAVCGCCGAPCAAVGPVVYGVRKVDPIDVGGSEAYRIAYNEAYASELKKRRWIWTGVGAGAGLVVGVGVAYAAGVVLGTGGVIPTTTVN